MNFIETNTYILLLGKSLGPNEQGELLIKGPQVMKGYYKRPEETEKSFMDGWFRTGDVAYYNEEGFFFITERLKELIKVSIYFLYHFKYFNKQSVDVQRETFH